MNIGEQIGHIATLCRRYKCQFELYWDCFATDTPKWHGIIRYPVSYMTSPYHSEVGSLEPVLEALIKNIEDYFKDHQP